MKVDAYICEACGKMKGETNHWFGLRRHSTLGTIVIISYSNIPEDEMEEFEHVCGAGCLLKRVDALAVTL